MASDRPRRLRTFLITPEVARAFLFLSVLTLLTGALNFYWTSRLAAANTARAHAQCAFDADLAPLPVTAPKTGDPSVLGVKLISDARIAWRRAGCPGRLPPPDPSFVKWARHYRLPAG